METIAESTINHDEEAQGVDSTSTESSISRTITENFTRIDRDLYKAAVEGDFNRFINVDNIECLLTPNKNTLLHVHFTSTTTTTATTQRFSEPFSKWIQDIFLDPFRFVIDTKFAATISEHFVQQIIEKCGGLVLLPNGKGETPLHLAARYGHYTVIDKLVERAKTLPFNIESGIVGMETELLRATTHENKDTALHEAVRGNHIEVVEILLEMDPDLVNIANEANETPLYLASERGYAEIVKKILVKVESAAAYQGPNGRTALHAVVINGDLGLTRDLLENEDLRGAVKHPDRESCRVPLHYAVESGHELLTKFLLEQDENTAYMQDSNGMTALHIAAHCNHEVIFDMIIKYYPDCSELVDNKGRNALHYAVDKHCYRTLVRIICNLSLSNLYNEKDVDGNTPLHHLTYSPMRINNLVSHRRVDKLALNKKDQTPLDVAYATLEDSDRPSRKQALIRHLARFGGKRGQRGRLHVNSNDKIATLEFTKEAKQSHLIVATLIATVTFAAAFTLPGGNWQDGDLKGTPIMAHRASFKAFIVSDTIALVMSASAALIHLFSPLKKSNWLDHYLSQVAFSFISVAVAAMIVAFGTGTYVVLGSSTIGIAVLTIGLLFFLIFRQVLRMSFKFNSILIFLLNLVNVISFSFNRFSPMPFGLVYYLFKRSKHGEKEVDTLSTVV